MMATFRCRQCNMQFLCQYKLIMHRYSHRQLEVIKENESVCQLCDKVCFNEDHLKNHVAQHVQKQKYVCGQCKRKFVTESRYLYHITTHPDRDANKCFLCSKIFSSKVNLENHVKLHTRETLFYCATCGKPFIRKKRLIIHETAHTKDFHCTICQEKFTSNKKLIQHRRSFHKPVTVFKCIECPKTYSRKCHLKIHCQMHTSTLPHVCKYCNQQFWRQDHMKKHENVHNYNSSTKECVCLVCDGYFHVDSFKQHMVTHHAGVNKFVCEICGKSFSKKVNLTLHKRSHKNLQ